MVDEYDLDKFKAAQAHGLVLKAAHSARNEIDDEMVRIYLIQWTKEAQIKGDNEKVQMTRSPSLHNKIEGATRLLSTTVPKFSVPRETNTSDTDSISSKIEKWCARLWECANRTLGEKNERAVAQSQLLFGETYIAVDRTSDIVKQLENRRGENTDDWLEAAIVRAQKIAKRVPYLFTVTDPRTNYPDFDRLGLRALYREVSTTAGAIQDEFGSLERLGEVERDDSHVLCHYWDFVWRYIYILDGAKPIIAEKHGLPWIPVHVQLGEGSRMLADEESWRLPFLYAAYRSGQWENENAYLTIMNTAVAAIGANPMYNVTLKNLERDFDVDHSVIGGFVKLEVGESYMPTPKAVIDQSMLIALDRARSDIEDSTIYSQTLGQPLGHQATYSETALLHQAGRLPLAMPQEMAGRAIAGAMKIALEWTKKDAGTSKIGSPGYYAELMASEIPDGVELDCKLDVALPQDRLGNVNVAKMITDPSNPIASKAWTQTNVMGIEQPDEMAKEIMAEQVSQALQMQYIQQMMQQQQMQQQQMQAMMQQQGGQMPGQPGMPPGQPGQPPMQPPQGMPPQVVAGGMQGPQPMPGEQQQLPPEMMQGQP